MTAAPAARARARALWRLAGCTAQIGSGLLICAVLFPFVGEARRMRHVGAWSRRMLAVLGVELRCGGDSAPWPAAGPGAAARLQWPPRLAGRCRSAGPADATRKPRLASSPLPGRAGGPDQVPGPVDTIDIEHGAGGGALWVANHVSWLDILAINAVQPVRFVSKADVRRWPLLGWLVACGGTLFIERERKRDALRVVHLMAGALRAGQRIAVFPEGTTADGHALLPFHANLLQPAIATGVPVQPVALRYADDREPVSRAAAFVGEQTAAASLWAVLHARGLTAHVTLLPLQAVGSDDRRALAARLHDAIDGALRGPGVGADRTPRRR